MVSAMSMSTRQASTNAIFVLSLTLSRLPTSTRSISRTAAPSATTVRSTNHGHITRRSKSSLAPSTQSHDPLSPSVPLTDLQLPITPLSSPLPLIRPTPIDRPTLERLHRLSALNPPDPGSEEETQLSVELGELVGLMDLVKNWEIPPGEEVEVGELLSEGVGEAVIDAPASESEDISGQKDTEGPREGEARGRELLEWGTNRVGDYYAHRVEKPRRSVILTGVVNAEIVH